MKKCIRILSVLLAAVLVAVTLVGCGGGQGNTPKDPDIDEHGNRYTGQMVEGGNTYADPNWLPVVKNPIKVSAVVREESDIGDWYTRSIWDEIENTTGVRFDIEVFTLNEHETLMFASRNYPDCAFRIYNTAFAYDDAKNNGDILELSEDLLEAYAPNWYRLFNEYDEIYQLCLHSDGKLYNLPNIQLEESTYKLRDLSVINATWLDELGMDVPTTVDEFTDYLRAVKNRAGTGTIPTEVDPLWMRNHVDIASYYMIMDWYGCYQGFADDYIQGGAVKSNFGNTAIKPAIKYIAQLYKEGLLNSDFSTADWTAHVTNIYDNAEAGHPTVGAYFAYDICSDDYIAFAPLDTGTGVKPIVHDFSFESRLQTLAFGIFSQTKYPIAILRAIDHYACGEPAIRTRIGEEGKDAQWIRDEEGDIVITDIAWSSQVPITKKGWNDYGPNIVEEEYAAALYKNLMTENTRIRWYYELYKDYLPEDKVKFPDIATHFLDAAEQSELGLLTTRVSSVNKSYVTKWITGKTDIDDEWDTYIDALEKAGLSKKLELEQKAWNLYDEAARD